MAYTAVPTFVTGDLFTAANANTYWRDNFAAGAPGIFTAEGDLHYATGASAGAALAIGEAGQVLSVNSGGTAPEWDGSLIGVGVSSTDTDLEKNVYKKIAFDTEAFDTGDFFSSTDSDAVKIPFTGVFQLSGTVTFDASTDGTAPYHDIRLGGATTLGFSWGYPGEVSTISFCYVNKFAANYDAYLEVKYSCTGTAYSTDYGIDCIDYQIIWLGTT